MFSQMLSVKHHSITLFSARPNDLIQVQAIFAKSTVPVKRFQAETKLRAGFQMGRGA